MSRAVAWFVHAATFLVGGTGIVYGVMRYLLRSSDPYAVVNHPWQPLVQHLHLLCAPLLVFAAGLLWRAHVWPGLRAGQKARRASGFAVTASLLPLIVSGPLIQITADERWRSAWVVVHVGSALLWIAGYAAHQIGSRRSALITALPASRPALRRRAVALAVIVSGAALLGAPRAAAAVTVERELAMMGTVLRMTIGADTRPAALAASERAVQALEAAEARLSTWRDDTELARLNRAPVGVPFALSPDLARELAVAGRWSVLTGGAFDPGIGALVEAWGLRGGGRVPDPAERRAAQAACGMQEHLGLGREVAVRLEDGLRVDEGGFGKGAGLDAALSALTSVGNEWAVLDLGGQVAVAGSSSPLPVVIADPDDRGRPVLEILLERGSVATSGNSERGVEVGGIRFGHILDPRRGEPCPDFGSVTVVAERALDADCLSTGLYVLGPDSALAWARSHPEIEVVVIETIAGGLRARATPGLAPQLVPLAADLTLD
jgi:thiamine biosynthesis lipoprotein